MLSLRTKFVCQLAMLLASLICVSLTKVDGDQVDNIKNAAHVSHDTVEGVHDNTIKEGDLSTARFGMTQIVNILFGILIISVIILKYVSSKVTASDVIDKKEGDPNQDDIDQHDQKNLKAQYRTLRLQYFPAYFAAIFGDWLQGPYVYKLYSEYGFQENQIAILFLTGFGSSFTFGTFTGPLADKFGRKSMTQVFCLLYSLSCVIKFSSNFWVLICGRIFAGIATSLLFR